MTYSELGKEAERLLNQWFDPGLEIAAPTKEELRAALHAVHDAALADSEADLDRWAESARRLEKAQGKIKAKAYEDAAKIVLKAFAAADSNGYGWVYDRAKYAAEEIRARAEEVEK